VTIDARPATVTRDNRFQGTATLVAGTTTVMIAATDPSRDTSAGVHEVDQTASAKTFTYDANGNLTSDGTRSFEWDAEATASQSRASSDPAASAINLAAPTARGRPATSPVATR